MIKKVLFWGAKFKAGIINFLDNAKSYKEELRPLLVLNFKTVGVLLYMPIRVTSSKCVKDLKYLN